ncbi:MAG: RagB/SusD family nutrient uptake outer membrane protein [Siphonobacter sp.]
MKRIYNRYLGSILLCIIASVVSSCKLNEEVYSSIYTENYYQTSTDAEKALIAAYSGLSGLASGPAILMASDYSADQIYPRAVVGRNTYTLFSYDVNYTTQKSNSRTFESPQQIWTSCYSGIEKANWVIAKVPAISMDETRRAQIVGEAYFLRAFYLWTLAKNFNEVPVKTTPSTSLDNAYVEKSSKADVYKQIYADLEQALLSGLPSYPDVDKGRPSNEVVSALYAKAALYNEDWAVALAKAQVVMNSGKYSLLSDVTNVFKYSEEDNARTENMWAIEIDPISPGVSSQITSLCGPASSAGPEYSKTSYGSMFAYQAFFNSFDPSDQRRELLDTTYVNKSGVTVSQKDITPITTDGVLIKKYQDPISSTGTIPNIQLLRYADMYLIAAEAEARLNGATDLAYTYINAIRNRAGLDDLQSGLSQSDFIDAVLQERSWEFFGEGDRWYDLTRTNTFLTVIPNAINTVYPTRTPQAKHRYFPIPLDEINANPKLVQNPDWQ